MYGCGCHLIIQFLIIHVPVILSGYLIIQFLIIFNLLYYQDIKSFNSLLLSVRPPSSWRMDTVKFYGLFPNHAPPHGGFTLSCVKPPIKIVLYVFMSCQMNK